MSLEVEDINKTNEATVIVNMLKPQGLCINLKIL